MSKEYNDFVAALEDQGIQVADDEMTPAEKLLVGKVWSSTLSFIQDNQLAAGGAVSALEEFTEPVKTMNENIGLEQIGLPALQDLCEQCDVRDDQKLAAIKSLAFCLSNKETQAFGKHFEASTGSLEGLDNGVLQNLNTVVGPVSMGIISENSTAAAEAFGQDVDKMTTDLKLTIALTLMKFHKNIIDRMINRKPVTGNVVQFQVPHAEAYDLEKSQDKDSKVRNRGDHRVPFIDLYKNPETANTAPKQIEVLKANDDDGVLAEDGRILMGKDVNLFDLAMDANRIGFSHVDYTDLVSEGVMLDTLFLQITKDNGPDPADVVLVPIQVKGRSASRFNMVNNTRDSADRRCGLTEVVKLSEDTLDEDGTKAAVLAAFTGVAFLRAKIKANGEINLKTADASCHGTVQVEVATTDGTDPVTAVTDALAALSFELVSYSLDAKYSEENMRKTTAAIRMHSRPMAYEIPVGKNVLVDYALTQTRPEQVLNVVSQAIAIGNDYRAIELIKETLGLVYNRIQEESTQGMFEDHRDRIGYDFVAGMQVMPSVIQTTMDLEQLVTTEASGRTLGDIRGAVEKFFIELFAKLFSDSMYMNVLDTGEKAYFRILTSGPIMAAILNVPHYHDHLNAKNTADGDIVEYTRVLPDGTVLEVITTTWESMTDKMLILPYRPKSPESELAFAQNCDRGTFVAHFSPTQFAATHKRIATNAREIPIVTNPLAIVLDVKNVSDLFAGMAGLEIMP